MNYQLLTSTFVGFLMLSSGFAQQDQNLVPNGHFEDYYMCPDDHSQIERLANWHPWTGTPDYFNSCDETEFVGVPLNQTHGFQNSRSGVGYGGFIAINYNGGREILGVELNEQLSIDQEYYVEFYMSRTFGGVYHGNCDCATSHLGALFTTDAYDNIENPLAATNTAQVFTTELVVDTVNWTKISGWFTADSAYSHLAIGNFFDLDSCEVEFYNGSPKEIFLKTYYYLEDVCVATDPAICDLWNKVAEQSEEAFRIEYVGPNQIRLAGLIEKSRVNIFDQSGRLIKTEDVQVDQLINTSDLATGIYVLSIESGHRVRTKRFVKN